MTKFEFTNNVLGSNNCIDVKEYRQGEIIDEKDLNPVLFQAWTERGVLVEVKEHEEEDDGVLGTEELIAQAKQILDSDDVDTDKLKEIGIRLHIKGMERTVNGETIIKKIRQFIEV